MSRLLIDEPPIAITPSLVRVVGGHDLAAFAQQVWYVAQGPHGIEHDGHRWAHQSIAQWCESVVLTEGQCKRIIAQLTDSGVLVRCQLPGYDRTAASRIDLDVLESHRMNLSDATVSNRPDQSVRDRPDGTVSNRPDVPTTRAGRGRAKRSAASSASDDPMPGLEAPARDLSPNQVANAMQRNFWQWVTERTGRPPVSVNPVGFQRLLAPFLEHGVTRDALTCAVKALYDTGAPLTRATIEAELDGRRRRPGGKVSVEQQLGTLRYDESGSLVQ